MDDVMMWFGMAFVGIIVICLGVTIVSYVIEAYAGDSGSNKKLIENMKKLDERNGR